MNKEIRKEESREDNPIREYRSHLIITEPGNVNHIVIKSETSMKRRSEAVLDALSGDFEELMIETFGDGAARFTKPRVVTDGVHSGSTMRSGCTNKTEANDDCSIRVTIGAVMAEDTHGPWVLETRPLNIDRDNNPCEECRIFLNKRNKQG